MYVNYLYYFNEYGGIMPEEAFKTASQRSEAYIRYLTFLNGDVFAMKEVVAVKQAVCAAADVYYADATVRAKQVADGRTGAVKSENNDGYSVSYVTEQVEGQTAEAVVRKKAYEAVYPYLIPTGWLGRRARCGNDYKY